MFRRALVKNFSDFGFILLFIDGKMDLLISEKWVLYPAALLRLLIPISGSKKVTTFCSKGPLSFLSKNPTDSFSGMPHSLLRLGFFTVEVFLIESIEIIITQNNEKKSKKRKHLKR